MALQKCCKNKTYSVIFPDLKGCFSQGDTFEDAFINVNLTTLKEQQEQLLGLKNKDEIDANDDIYNLTQEIIDKKSDFASSLLYIAYTDKNVEWTTPKYIEEGLEWLQKQQ